MEEEGEGGKREEKKKEHTLARSRSTGNAIFIPSKRILAFS